MKLGPALTGAIGGALVGLVAYLALEVGAAVEAPWFAVVTGLLTGLGVRMLDSTVKTNASVGRAALAGVVALVAIVGGSLLASQLVVQTSSAGEAARPAAEPPAPAPQPEPADTEEAEEGAEESAEGEEEASEPEPEPAPPTPTPTADPIRLSVNERNEKAAPEFSVFQFIMITVGSLVAYEMARGSSPSTKDSEDSESGEPAGSEPESPPADPAE